MEELCDTLALQGRHSYTTSQRITDLCTEVLLLIFEEVSGILTSWLFSMVNADLDLTAWSSRRSDSLSCLSEIQQDHDANHLPYSPLGASLWRMPCRRDIVPSSGKHPRSYSTASHRKGHQTYQDRIWHHQTVCHQAWRRQTRRHQAFSDEHEKASGGGVHIFAWWWRGTHMPLETSLRYGNPSAGGQCKSLRWQILGDESNQWNVEDQRNCGKFCYQQIIGFP